MGLKPSPYNNDHSFLWGEESIQGNRKFKSNTLYWDIVQPNLPGDVSYNLSAAWICKVDLLSKKIANSSVTYTNNVQLIVDVEQKCVQVIQRFGSMMNHLQQQNTVRKTHPSTSEELGKWAGKILGVVPNVDLLDSYHKINGTSSHT
eukprot:10001120-Ditylum_brightwellii.AAC.1